MKTDYFIIASPIRGHYFVDMDADSPNGTPQMMGNASPDHPDIKRFYDINEAVRVAKIIDSMGVMVYIEGIFSHEQVSPLLELVEKKCELPRGVRRKSIILDECAFPKDSFNCCGYGFQASELFKNKRLGLLEYGINMIINDKDFKISIKEVDVEGFDTKRIKIEKE